MDIEALYDIPDWRETPDEIIEHEYAALYFLSPAGFRHFVPAGLRWVLLHPHSSAAVGDSTVFALTPQEGELRDFSLSKFSGFNEAQRDAVAAALGALHSGGSQDVVAALDHWRDLTDRRPA